MKFFFPRQGSLDQLQAQLQAGLDKLNLVDNFQGFEWQGEIPPSSQVSIRNKLRQLPRGYFVTMAEGTNTIAKVGEWTQDKVSLENFHTTLTAKVTVFFYR